MAGAAASLAGREEEEEEESLVLSTAQSVPWEKKPACDSGRWKGIL